MMIYLALRSPDVCIGYTDAVAGVSLYSLYYRLAISDWY